MAVVMDVNVSLDRDVKERSKDRDAFAREHGHIYIVFHKLIDKQ